MFKEVSIPTIYANEVALDIRVEKEEIIKTKYNKDNVRPHISIVFQDNLLHTYGRIILNREQWHDLKLYVESFDIDKEFGVEFEK